MLHVHPTKHNLHFLNENHQKEKYYFLIKDNQFALIEQIVDEMLFAIFQKSQSFLIILFKKFIFELINRKLSFPLLEEIFQLLKKYQEDIKVYKQHFFQLDNIMFEEQLKNPNQNLNQEFQKGYLLDCSIANNKQEEKIQVEQTFDNITSSNDKYPKSLCYDIDCYSEDSKYNIASFDDKYFCSQYLTTSEDQRQLTSKSTILKQFKQQMQNKLKIHPHVSAFSFNLSPKKVSIDIQQEILQWKRTKKSILQEPSLRKALSPLDFDQRLLIQKMKQNHYRQKIKSVIVKKRLSNKHEVFHKL